MRKLTKNTDAPSVLTNAKAQSSMALICKKVENEETKNLPFDDNIYGHKSVKAQLVHDQHGKCAFCECFLNGDFGAVEHYRPKGGYNIAASQPLKKPGYYWLAYDWENLLLSCSTCNTSYKRNIFPLSDESKRDISHRAISQESPLIINPYVVDPDNHLTFAQHIVKPKTADGTTDAIGKFSIDALGLNREVLKERRKQKWDNFKKLSKLIAVFEKCCTDLNSNEESEIKQALQEAKTQLARFKSAESEYSGMFINQEEPV